MRINEVEITLKTDDIFAHVVLNKDTWEVASMCTATGEQYSFTCTGEQASAIVALFVAGDFDNQELNTALYKLAEEALKGCPQNCRLIP